MSNTRQMWSRTTSRLLCCIGICVSRPPRRNVRSTDAVSMSTSPTSSGPSRGRASRAISLSRATSKTHVPSSCVTRPLASRRVNASSTRGFVRAVAAPTSSAVRRPRTTAPATRMPSSSASTASAASASSTSAMRPIVTQPRTTSVDRLTSLRQLDLTGDDAVCELVQLQVVVTCVSAKHREGLVDLASDPGGDQSLRLLDLPPRVQRRLQLVDDLALPPALVDPIGDVAHGAHQAADNRVVEKIDEQQVDPA